jgi:hypothetical protein
VVIPKPINTAKQVKAVNVTSAGIAIKRLRTPLDTIYYRRQVSHETVRIVLQAHAEGSSLRGVSRISELAYNTGVSLIRAASQKRQLIHNQDASNIETQKISADKLWSFVEKNKNTVFQKK